MTTQFVNIVQDNIALEVEYEIHDPDTGAARLEIHDILHRGESINDLLVSPDPADWPLMTAIEAKTVQAWAHSELDAATRTTRAVQISFTAHAILQRIRDEATAAQKA